MEDHTSDRERTYSNNNSQNLTVLQTHFLGGLGGEGVAAKPQYLKGDLAGVYAVSVRLAPGHRVQDLPLRKARSQALKYTYKNHLKLLLYTL